MATNRLTVIAGLVAMWLGSVACNAPQHHDTLGDYYRYNNSPRDNLPADYIAFLKIQPRFQGGKLDGLPAFAVILYSDPIPTLNAVGIKPPAAPLEIGTATPERLYILRTSRGTPFMLIQGQAGAGGVTTIAGEVAALGARYIVHIGTCAALGPEIPANTAVVSTGSYKDGAAVLLSDGDPHEIDPIAYPDERLSEKLAAGLDARHLPHMRALGFTSPIYYFEPTAFFSELMTSNRYRPTPRFIEMEEGPFFATTSRMKVAGASIVVAADRYLADGKALRHDFLDSPQPTIELSLSAALDVFDEIVPARIFLPHRIN